MMENRTVAPASTTLSFMRRARCQRQAAGKNITPYNRMAPMNQPTRIERSVSRSVAGGMRWKTKYKALTVTATHTNFHLIEIHFRLGLPEAVSAGKAVARISPTKIHAPRRNRNQQFPLCAEARQSA